MKLKDRERIILYNSKLDEDLRKGFQGHTLALEVFDGRCVYIYIYIYRKAECGIRKVVFLFFYLNYTYFINHGYFV